MSAFEEFLGREPGEEEQQRYFEEQALSSRPFTCRMSEWTALLQRQDARQVFLEPVIFEVSGQRHRAGMSVPAGDGPCSYVFDTRLFSSLAELIGETILSQGEESIRILGFGEDTDGSDYGPWKVVMDCAFADEDYRALRERSEKSQAKQE